MAGPGSAPELAGGAMEGKEVRFGTAASALFGAATTGTSTGAVNSMHDSFTAPGGGVALFNMMLGEIAPGGVGAGLYGMLMLAVVTVFLSGLMVGRTPEYLGKKIGQREIVMVALYVLTTPVLVLVGSAVALTASDGLAGLQASGPHGLSEAVYAVTSASNNNGSAFAGLTSGTPFWNTLLGLCMLLGRFVPIVFVLALAGRFATQQQLHAERRNPAHPSTTVRGPPQRRRAGRGRRDPEVLGSAASAATVAGDFDEMQLIEMQLRIRLGNLHPADLGPVRAQHLDLLKLVAVGEAGEDAFLIPSAKSDQQRLRALKIKRQRKIVVLDPPGAGRQAAEQTRRWDFRTSAHRQCRASASLNGVAKRPAAQIQDFDIPAAGMIWRCRSDARSRQSHDPRRPGSVTRPRRPAAATPAGGRDVRRHGRL